ncbi:hypothetical protein KUTeg_012409 [Tegillarca granosa]|uniref:Uncharacterized protein n=1 Tax=Tegillarca granosa TaxID=220873 RepID=A0ABQ9EZM8_TEGGR|nr:hypothetical protein KUTeg_012409 [Tegillarca granosa]
MNPIVVSKRTTVQDLKSKIFFPSQNNLKISGTKLQVAQRVVDFISNSRPTTNEHTDDHNIVIPDTSTCNVPKITELNSGWTSKTDNLPRTRINDVENYLLHSSHKTEDSNKMKCYRQYIRGLNFFKEGYIHKVMINQISDDSDLCYVRSKCHPSMKSGIYEQWILILGEGCTHVAGLLFALEGQPLTKNDEIPCTSQPCQWNQPSKRKRETKPVHEISFKKIKYDTDTTIGKKKSRKHVKFNIDHDDLNVAHFENVETSDHIVVASDKYINIIETVQNLEKESVNESNIISELSTCTQEIVAEVNDRTVGQHQNPMWLSARSGRITASNFHDVKTKKDSTKSDCLVSKFLCKSSGSVDKSALIWGRKQEPIAKKPLFLPSSLGQQNQTLTNPFQPHRLTTQVCICKRRTKRLKPVYVPISFSKPQTKVEIFSCPFCRTSTIPFSLVRRCDLNFTALLEQQTKLLGMTEHKI